MMEEPELTPKSELSLDEAVRGVLSRRGIGDTKNNFHKIRVWLEIPEHWSKVKPAQTYGEYIREKYAVRPELAEAVIAASDKQFVETYDALAQKINNAIGEGVTSQQQIETIGPVLAEADSFIDGYC